MKPVVYIAGIGMAVALVGVLAASCSESAVGPETTDATDARVVDPRDGGRLDAAADARDANVSVDAGELDIPGEWEKIQASPGSCPLWTLRDASVIPPLPWKTCANGRPDCRFFSADWEERGVVWGFMPWGNDPVHERSGDPRVAYVRGTRHQSKFLYFVVQSMEGQAHAAYAAYAPTCASMFGASQHGFAMGLYSETEGGFLGFAPPTAPGAMTFAKATIEPTLDAFSGTTPLANGILVEQVAFGTRNHSARYDLQTKTFYGPGILSEQPVRLGEGFIALMATSPPVIAYVPPAGGYQPLRRAAPGHQFFTLTDDHDTSAIVWAEDDGNQNMTIWTSPAATTEAAMQPRQVAKLRFVSKIVARNGVIAIRPNEGLARLIRLSDGMGWDLPTDDGLEFANPLWLNEEAVWFLASRRYNGGFPFNSGIRYARNALGPPTVPSGL